MEKHMFTDKELDYIERCKTIGREKGDCQELRDIAKAAYSDYRNGVISSSAYNKIYAICTDYAYPR